MLERILIFSGAVFVYYVLIGLINLTRECRDRRSHLDFYFEVDITVTECRDRPTLELHPPISVKTGI